MHAGCAGVQSLAKGDLLSTNSQGPLQIGATSSSTYQSMWQ